MKSTLKLYLDLARCELTVARRHRALGYASSASDHIRSARQWIAAYWHAKPRA